ncbi:hypothetical protein Pint_20122 [Pistacia integerrima]|uniref:Uncharacterized protein n=1 Tax=Pistacia integerrima TaxID=434235 RepID=A0ACC0XBW4_9ROSI|nr:hypothetical protein Pint_20122 [Pistacia integerrima]
MTSFISNFSPFGTICCSSSPSNSTNKSPMKQPREDWRRGSKPIPLAGTYPAKDHFAAVNPLASKSKSSATSTSTSKGKQHTTHIKQSDFSISN